MQLPSRDTPVSRCETLAHFTAASSRRYVALMEPTAEIASQLVGIVNALEGGLATLMATQDAYRSGVLACIAPRVEVKLVDHKADNEVRSGKRAADDAGKDVAAAVYPDGTTPIIRPIGQSEVNELRLLEGRILAAVPRWTGATASHARIAHVRTQYETALTNRSNALSAAAHKRALRNAAKEDFLDLFAKAAGTIKALFPRDRAVQDIFFDDVRASDDSEPEAVVKAT